MYPDQLCIAILEGLVNQMREDGRIGCSFKTDDPEINLVCIGHNLGIEGDRELIEED